MVNISFVVFDYDTWTMPSSLASGKPIHIVSICSSSKQNVLELKLSRWPLTRKISSSLPSQVLQIMPTAVFKLYVLSSVADHAYSCFQIVCLQLFTII